MMDAVKFSQTAIGKVNVTAQVRKIRCFGHLNLIGYTNNVPHKENFIANSTKPKPNRSSNVCVFSV